MGTTIDRHVRVSISHPDPTAAFQKNTTVASKTFESVKQGIKSALTTSAGMAGGPVASAIVNSLLGGGKSHEERLAEMTCRNMELLNLQMQVQQMSQSFQMQSNIMKTDHDARMASIRNIKG